MPPNPMMQALEQSRQQNPVSSSGPTPGGPPQPAQPQQNPEMEKYWSMMQDMNGKLDKLIEAISGAVTGKTPPPDGDDEKEINKHGSSGY